MTTVLEKLSSPDFEAAVMASTPRVLLHLLGQTPEVKDLRRAYDNGELGSGEIREFINDLLRAHRDEPRFPYQVLLAAICSGLETRFDSFSGEYLADLARLRSERFGIASRVAALVLSRREQRITNSFREFSPRSGDPQVPEKLEAKDYFRQLRQAPTVSREAFQVSA